MDIKTFGSADFGDLRVMDTAAGTLFCGRDVASALGYSNPADAISRHCKGVVNRYPLQTLGGTQEVRFITEADVFRLIVSSKLPSAQVFEAWVFEEVLPSIRRDGAYVASDGTEDDAVLMARALQAAQRTIERNREEIAELSPKAVLCDAMLLPSRETYTVSEAARYLANVIPSVKRQDVFDALRSSGMMCKGSTAPTRRAIAAGRMVAVASEYRDPDTGEERAGRQRGRLTPKGVGWLTCVLGGGAPRCRPIAIASAAPPSRRPTWTRPAPSPC